MAVLVDTSVWLDYFQGGDEAVAMRLHQFLDAGEVVISGLVEFELLQILPAKDAAMVMQHFEAMDYVLPERVDYHKAAELLRTKAELSSSVCVIAAQAMRLGLGVFSLDRQFSEIDGLELM